jgi:allantoin racemase
MAEQLTACSRRQGFDMKIWHQSMTDLASLPNYQSSLEDHSAHVCEPGTVVHIKGMPNFYTGGITTTDVLGSPYLYHLAFRRIIDQAIESERQEYDAFVVGSFSEPFLRELRATVDIPVVSAGESNFLVACSLGKLQALIANVPTVARLVQDHVAGYGLNDRVQGVYALAPTMTEDELQAQWSSPESVIARFDAIAETAILAGADVIIPAEGVLSELLYQHGHRRLLDVPILDSFGVCWKYAEMFVQLRHKLGVEVGRAWEYRRPSDEKLATFAGIIGRLE